MYVISGAILVSLVLAVWIALLLKKDDASASSGWMGR
jgi:hypothetical protein